MVGAAAFEQARAFVTQVVEALLVALLAMMVRLESRRFKPDRPPVLGVAAEAVLEAHYFIGGPVGKVDRPVIVLEQGGVDAAAQVFPGRERMHVGTFRLAGGAPEDGQTRAAHRVTDIVRSEERRVGKECRAR